MADRSTSYAVCCKIELTDNTVIGLTGHDIDIVFDSVTYKATAGLIPSAVQSSTSLAPDNIDLNLILDSGDITTSDLRAGKYDDADITIFTIDYLDIAGGIIYQSLTGKLGSVEMDSENGTVEANNLAYELSNNIGRTFGPCDADLGDSRCGVSMVPTAWASGDYALGDEVSPGSYNGRMFVCTTAGTTAGTEPASWNLTLDGTTTDGTVVWTTKEARTKTMTVTGTPTDRLTFQDSSRTETDGYFNGGKCTWLTGPNTGYAMDIKDYDQSTTTFILFEPMPFDIDTGHTATITTGCDKTMARCQEFNNFINNPGFYHIPGTQKLASG